MIQEHTDPQEFHDHCPQACAYLFLVSLSCQSADKVQSQPWKQRGGEDEAEGVQASSLFAHQLLQANHPTHVPTPPGTVPKPITYRFWCRKLHLLAITSVLGSKYNTYLNVDSDTNRPRLDAARRDLYKAMEEWQRSWRRAFSCGFYKALSQHKACAWNLWITNMWDAVLRIRKAVPALPQGSAAASEGQCTCVAANFVVSFPLTSGCCPRCENSPPNSPLACPKV